VGKSAARRREALGYDPRVVVEFNKKAYANTEIIIFWLEELLLPNLGPRPTLLIMDLRSHKTGPVREISKANDIALSLVPAGCTGLVQPIDISINRPFKDLLKGEIGKEFERRDNGGASDEVVGSSAVGKMRVMMTRCVAEAWKVFVVRGGRLLYEVSVALASRYPLTVPPMAKYRQRARNPRRICET